MTQIYTTASFEVLNLAVVYSQQVEEVPTKTRSCYALNHSMARKGP